MVATALHEKHSTALFAMPPPIPDSKNGLVAVFPAMRLPVTVMTAAPFSIEPLHTPPPQPCTQTPSSGMSPDVPFTMR